MTENETIDSSILYGPTSTDPENVKRCPECGCTHPHRRTVKEIGRQPDDDAKYRCDSTPCGATFDTPHVGPWEEP